MSPPVERLGPLLEYRDLCIENGSAPAEEIGDEALPVSDPSACSAFPAGLVPRFQNALAAGGYEVTVSDRRQFGQAFRVDKEFCRQSRGEARALLRAVVAEPLGQVEFRGWDDLIWRMPHLCGVYPEARTLIAADTMFTADDLYQGLYPRLGESVGVFPAEGPWRLPRCPVTGLRWLPRLGPGCWDVLLILVNRLVASEAIYRAVLRLRARRVYSLVPPGLRLSKRSRLRMEAMSGQVIDAPSPP